MPTYIVTDPQTGQKLRLTGDTPPTDADLDGIFAQQSPELRPEQAATHADVDFIPTEENLAIQPPQKPERSIGDVVEGIGEAALTLGTGVTTGALGFGAGSLSGAIGELTGRLKPGEGLEEAQALAAKLTNLPESEAGQEYVKDIGEKLGVLPPVLGTGPVVGLNAASKLRFSKSKSPLAKKIAEESTGNVQKSFTKKLGEDRFEPHIFGMVKEARKQGFDDGMTTVMANASPIDKRRMLQMVGKLEKGKSDAKYQAKNRPADIAGDSLLRKIDFVKSNNKQAGAQLNRVATTLKGKEVDVNDSVTKFINDLDGLGIKLDKEGVPSFGGSVIEGVTPAETLINKIVARLKRNPEPDALEAHNFKKFIDENVNFGKSAEGLGGKAERVVKKLRSGINESIGGKYDKYKEANTRFSDTIQALDSLQDAAGKKLDFFGPNADKATGTVLRRLMSNAQGRVLLMDAIDNIEVTAKKYGGAFDDDIMTQMLFADELDAVFGGGARTSLKGEIKKANVESAIDISQMSIPGVIAVGAKAGARKLRGINEKNQLKAIKKLLRSSK